MNIKGFTSEVIEFLTSKRLSNEISLSQAEINDYVEGFSNHNYFVNKSSAQKLPKEIHDEIDELWIPYKET